MLCDPILQRLAAALIAASALVAPAVAQQAQPPQDLTLLSLEDLMQVEVEASAPGRKAQAVEDTPAAVHVLTAEDIRRSGATTLPEVLRLVPGLHVARLGASRWAISARGFNEQFANKMLVLIDGRSVYTPLFSGVYWDVQDVPLQTIERIEVVLGPGAAMWGANAVNGVINVVTRSSADMQGTLVSGLAGTEDRFIGLLSQGGRFGQSGTWSLWGRYADRDGLGLPAGGDAGDESSLASAGFRADWLLGQRDNLFVQGQAYGGDPSIRYDVIEPAPPFASSRLFDVDTQGGHLLGRWTRELGERSGLGLQVYYDRTERDTAGLLGEERDAFDLDFQHRFSPFARHDLVWGLGLRNTHSEITEQSFALGTTRPSRTDGLYSVFLQDEIALVPERLSLVLGGKVEHNDYTGFELQPNARMLWRVSPAETLWAAVSRAVRSPSQVEADFLIPRAAVPGTPPTFFVLRGDDDFESENLLANELGYRNRISDTLSLDVAAFFNLYDSLRTLEPQAPEPGAGAIIVPIEPRNLGEAQSWGAELELEWRASERTRLVLGYAWMQLDFDTDSSSGDPSSEEQVEGNLPQHQAQLRIQHDLSAAWDLDAGLYYVDSLDFGDVPSYLRLDLRAEWRPRADLRLVLGAQGLLHDEEVEFGDWVLGGTNAVQQAFYLGLTWSR